jgi:hypothetical protein
MHKSLTPRNNLLLIFVWAAVIIAISFATAYPDKPLMIGLGAALGVVAGVLQLRALQESKDRFLAATTVLEVRSAMTSSRSGRFAIFTLYTAAGILFIVEFIRNKHIGLGLIAAYAAFAFVRDCIALKGCVSLQRAADSK